MARRTEPGVATLRGLRDRGHDARLLTAQDSPLAKRASESGIPVHQIPRLGLRLWAAGAIADCFSGERFDIVHLMSRMR